ncbi:MAG TPA: iron-containing alcohol dehydrogenase [Acidobacteriaceae bacterium]|nr:iron-containing alcohol dehydrogenase [Acidobacteriaceae bacterium]
MALISYLTEIHFGFGEVATLKNELRRLNVFFPMVITDKGIRECGLFDRISQHLPALHQKQIFDNTLSNPTQATVREATAQFRNEKFDGIVAVGGGSPIDLAKAVALMGTHPGSLDEYSSINKDCRKIGASVAPVIAVGTTAGTGSEVGRAAVIIMEDGYKLPIVSPHLIPKSAICDPELTLGMPSSLTSGTGMDAISHCIETFLSPRINPPAEAIALSGLARGVKYIARACDEGTDKKARWHMMMTSIEGGLTFQKGLGAVHAMSHPLGALHKPFLHHGTLNGLLLPFVLRFNREFVGDKYRQICKVLEIPANSDLPKFFHTLNIRLNLPGSLKELNVPEDLLATLARAAMYDPNSQTNPRPVDAEAYLTLFREAYEGF